MFFKSVPVFIPTTTTVLIIPSLNIAVIFKLGSLAWSTFDYHNPPSHSCQCDLSKMQICAASLFKNKQPIV